MAGLDANGFTVKRLDEILADKNTAVQSVFGPDLNVSPQSPDGQINGLLAQSDSDLWQLAEIVYNAFNPNAAFGLTLRNLVPLNGITWQAATASQVTLQLTGIDATVIPAGARVRTVSNVLFETLADATIVSGVASVAAQAVETGPLEAPAGTVTVIVNPVTGWDTVTNPADAVPGREDETDAELRQRRAASVAFPSQSLVDSISSAVGDVEGVTEVIVLENDKLATDVNGQPGKTTQTIAVGGSDAAVAQAIFFKKAAGIEAYGTSVTVPVEDSQGQTHDIGITRPGLPTVYVEMTLSTTAEFPADGVDQITQAILAYAAGDEPYEGCGFKIGDDVIYTRLFTPINSVKGHDVLSLTIGLTASPTGTSNIPIAFNELADFDASRITINV